MDVYVIQKIQKIPNLLDETIKKLNGSSCARFLGSLCVFIVGILGCVFIDNETHESGVTKCTTGEAWSAFSWHHSSVFHC